jgi:protein-S-isoprenylcysteine O-methyltransferase Ste14
MLWLRGLLFTVLLPGTVAVWLPQLIRDGAPMAGGWWHLGWLPIVPGPMLLLWSIARFLLAGGTPATCLLRPLRALVGQEPTALVRRGPYRFTRNPMYIGVLLLVFGQAMLYRSAGLAVYGAALWLLLHVFVVVVEEPHLRSLHGAEYDRFCAEVPRWL